MARNINGATRWMTVAAGVSALLIGAAAPPAAARPMARPWPGEPVSRPHSARATCPGTRATMCDTPTCPLRRVGTRFVRGDDGTGAGRVAPPWIPAL